MLDHLANREERVVGVREVTRLLKADGAATVLLARDAAPPILEEISALARTNGVPLKWVDTMAHLARLCLVSVPSAAAAIRKVT